jgi:hypothetical protein
MRQEENQDRSSDEKGFDGRNVDNNNTTSDKNMANNDSHQRKQSCSTLFMDKPA